MKKLSIVLLVAFAMILYLTQAAFADDVWDGRTSEPFAGGSGTSEDPYLIANGAQLYYLSLNCADSAYNTASYKITNDIYLDDNRFSPISSFSGTLDGDGHAIYGLKVISSGSTYTGLILNGANCEIENLALFGRINGPCAGAFLGFAQQVTLINCTNYCNVTTTTTSSDGTGSVYRGTGGIVGCIHASSVSTLSGCINNGIISGLTCVGGIVGCADNVVYGGEIKKTWNINNCINTGTIIGRDSIGGIVGYAVCYKMNKCVNAGEVIGTLTDTTYGRGNIGGLIGSSIAGSIWNQYSHKTEWYASSVSDSYNVGKISINGDYYYAGGIWGYSNYTKNTVSRCYNVGLVSGSSTCSDICPVSDYVLCSNSYYLADLNTDVINPTGSVGNSEEEMRLPAGFSGFDFNNVWGWDESEYYPYPILKDIGLVVACMHIPVDAVQERIVAATCEEAGGYDDVVYCSVCEEELSRTRIIVPALGHKWGEPVWYWSGSTSAMASFTCQNDNNHTRIIPATIDSSTVAATCEDAGKTTYTATVTLDDVSYSDSKEEPIPALKHDWHFVDFTWTGSETDGYTAAVANFICLNNDSHTETIDAVISTATSENKIIYTASVGAEISLDKNEHVDLLSITGYTVKLDNRTYEAAAITGVDNGGIYIGNVTLIISCDKPYTVMYTVDDGDSFTRLTANMWENSYTLNVTKDLTIVVALNGDINGDGDINNKDATRLMRYIKYHDVEVTDFALDVNGDGEVNNKDVTRLMRYIKYGDVGIF